MNTSVKKIPIKLKVPLISQRIPIKLKTNTSLLPIQTELPPSQNSNSSIIRRKITLKIPPDIIVETKQTKIPVTLNSLNTYLDQHFLHNLMMIKDSWSEVKYKIRMDSSNQECWWDLEILLKHFAEQLNTSCMNNPSPQYPSNPFNRQPFTRIQLLTLANQVKDLKLIVNLAVAELFEYLKTTIDQNNQFLTKFVNYLSVGYRFRVVNYKDSQDNYLGYWINRKDPLTTFETLYHQMTLITPSYYDSTRDRLVERHEYVVFKTRLNSLPLEQIDLDTMALDYRYQPQ